MTKLRLRVVYDDPKGKPVIYAEFTPEDFKMLLLKFTEELQDVDEAFEKTCSELKKKLLSM
jgi:hypothetical protein